jgi:hypothetical protein
MITQAILLFFTVLNWMSEPSNGPRALYVDPTEEYDVLMTDGEIDLGLVRMRQHNDEYCAVVADVKVHLGYPFDPDDLVCLSLQHILSKHGIPLTLRLSSVELLLDAGYHYPAKDYKRAKDRLEKAPSRLIGHEIYLRKYRSPMLPTSRRFDLSLVAQNQRLHSPDIHSTIAGDVLGGSFMISGFATKKSSIEEYNIHSSEFGWLWVPNKRSNIVPYVHIGTNVVDDRITFDKGLRISNKPLASRDVNINTFIPLDVPIGSIVEWSHHAGNYGRSVVDNSRYNRITAPIGYGLNKIQYSITSPGEVTKHQEQWIRVPQQLLSKGSLEYQTTFGSIDLNRSTTLISTKVDYGLGSRISIGSEQQAFIGNGIVNNQLGTRVVWMPTRTSEVHAQVGTDSRYLLNASYWNPRYGSIDISDSMEPSNLFQTYRPNRRQSMIRVSANGTRYIKYQFAYTRSEYNGARGNAIESFINTSYRKSMLAANFSYRWWQNAQIRSMGYTSANWYLGHKLNNKIMISTDLNTTVVDPFHIQSFRLSSHYHTRSAQIGGSVSMHAPFQSVSLNVYTRITTDWITLASRNEYSGTQHYGSQSVSTSWLKSRSKEWLPSSQSSQGSAGFFLVPYHDRNGNGVKDSDEVELSGLMGSIRDGRLIELKKSNDKLIFGGLQPFRNYTITLDSDLRNEPDYLVQSTHIKVESPSSGYRIIYIPVVKSIEVNGIWEVPNGVPLKLGQTDLVFTKTDGSLTVRGTLFSDGTWIVDKIGTGSYLVKVRGPNAQVLTTSPSVLHIGQLNSIENPKLLILPKS